MRREQLYLADILGAVEDIGGFLEGRSRDGFLGDDLVQSAVLHKLTIIGEAAARLPKRFRDRFPGVPWVDIIGFRNIVVHSYFAVDWEIVWTTATVDVPQLGDQVRAIAATLE